MSDPVQIDATALDRWQRCRRLHLLSREWVPQKYRPKALYDACLRQAVFAMSSGAGAADVATEAKARFLQQAANPGLDLPPGANPYVIARDWCAMLDTVLRAVGGLTLLVVREAATVPIARDVQWAPIAWADESGQLHRWITLDAWGDNDIYREAHSWQVFGDIAVTRCPLMLHVVVIGQQRNGRRASSWARGWRNPNMPNTRMHFRRRDGGALVGWKPVYLADDTNLDPGEWAEQMAAEGEVGRLTKHIVIDVPPEDVCVNAVQQIVDEARAMQELEGRVWHTLPMSRGACDGLVPCAYQPCCYSPELVQVERLGWYKRRVTDRVLAQGGTR